MDAKILYLAKPILIMSLFCMYRVLYIPDDDRLAPLIAYFKYEPGSHEINGCISKLKRLI